METEAQAAKVHELGYDLQQGYLHGKPMPAEQAAGYIRERNGSRHREAVIESIVRSVTKSA